MKNTLITIAVLIASAVVGWLVFRLAMGLVFFVIVAIGAVSGFFVAKLIYQRKKNDG